MEGSIWIYVVMIRDIYYNCHAESDVRLSAHDEALLSLEHVHQAESDCIGFASPTIE